MATEATGHYCPICGKPGEPEFDRFGEWACSDAHANEHVAEVRARKQRLLASDALQDAQRVERPRRQFRGG